MGVVLPFGEDYLRAAASLLCKDTKAAVSLLESWLSSVVLGPSVPARLVRQKHSCFLKLSCSGEGRLFPASGAAAQLLSAHWGHK